jgi:hypothetical protein
MDDDIGHPIIQFDNQIYAFTIDYDRFDVVCFNTDTFFEI